MNSARAVRFAVALVLLSAGAGGAARAETLQRPNGVGLGVAAPAIGLSLHRAIDARHASTLVIGDPSGEGRFGVTARVERARKPGRGGYFLLGLGVDSTATLVQGGYGYRLPFLDRFHLDAALSLNVPLRMDTEEGLLQLFYLSPLSLSVRYLF